MPMEPAFATSVVHIDSGRPVQVVAGRRIRGTVSSQTRASDISDSLPRPSVRDDDIDADLAYLQPTRGERLLMLLSRWFGILVFVVVLGLTGYLLSSLVA